MSRNIRHITHLSKLPFYLPITLSTPGKNMSASAEMNEFRTRSTQLFTKLEMPIFTTSAGDTETSNPQKYKL